MTFAIVANSTKIYPIDPQIALRSTFEQVLEFQLTAAASDTAMNLASIAAADSSGQGAAITTLLSKVASMHSEFILESPRAVAATGAAHTLTGTAIAPVFTFTGTASTPTLQSYCLTFRILKDENPEIYGV